jgi:hypothetical protein
MAPRDLREHFFAGKVPADELRIVLLDHFGQVISEEETIVYQRDQEDALAILYSKKGSILDIKPRAAFRDTDLDEIRKKIEESILPPGQRKIRRELLFSSVPVTGAWRYRDQFQILPAPANVPRPPWPIGDHPFVLEVPFLGSIDSTIAVVRAQRCVDEVALVLAGLLPSIKGRLQDGQQEWAILLEGGETQRSRWVQRTYAFENFQHQTEHFTEIDAPPIERIDDSVFYDGVHTIPGGGGDALDLPESIELLLQRVENLGVDRRSRFLRWSHWLSLSRQSSGLSSSFAYLASIQAIEALQRRVSNPQCTTCGQELPPGPTGRFADFLDRLVPRQDGETEKERKKLYALRSSLTHGRAILESDLASGWGSFHPSWIDESRASRYASQLARLAGVNWLLEDGE